MYLDEVDSRRIHRAFPMFTSTMSGDCCAVTCHARTPRRHVGLGREGARRMYINSSTEKVSHQTNLSNSTKKFIAWRKGEFKKFAKKHFME